MVGQLIGGISGEEKISKRYGEHVADALWSMHWRGHEIIYDRVEKYGIDCDLKSGYIEVALKKRQLQDLEDQFDTFQRRDFPYEYRMLSRSETQEIVGTDAYVGSMYNLRDGHLHPLNLLYRGSTGGGRPWGADLRGNRPSPTSDMERSPGLKLSTVMSTRILS